MRLTGMVRKVDELGRIVLPVELRRSLNIDTRDSVEIIMRDDSIVLWKVQTNCAFCGTNRNLSRFGAKQICKGCCKQIRIIVEEDDDD